MHKLRGNFFVNSYVKAKFLTHDPERIASYDSDPLITRPISVNILLGLYEAADRVVADAQRDHAADAAADLRRRLGGAPRAAARVLRPARQRGQGASTCCPASSTTRWARRTARRPSQAIRDFVLRAVRRSRRSRVDLRDAAPERATRATSRARWPQPLPPLSPRGLYWAVDAREPALRRPAVATACGSATRPASIRAARSTTSTATSRSGATPLGRSIDRTYLDSIGWRGIRQRKLHVEELLREAMRAAGASSTAPVRLIDIAAGHGRYVLDAVLASPVKARLDPAARLQRHQRARRPRADRREGPGGHRAVRAGRRLRPREPRRA